MAEWSKAAASKAVIPPKSGIGGSNPPLSSTLLVGIRSMTIRCRLVVSLIIVMISRLSCAMMFDNRFIPLIPHPYLTAENRPSHCSFDLFALTACQAFNDNDSEFEIPELYGAYDQRDIADSFVAIGKPNPLPTNLRLLEIPWILKGKIQGQGLSFGYRQQLGNHFAFGLRSFIMRLNTRQDFTLKSENGVISPAEQQQLEILRRSMQAQLGLQADAARQSGFGDIELYLRLGNCWEYALKCRKIDAGVRFGVVIPTGVIRDINYPSSIPFDGDGHWGIYSEIDAELEVKEDWKVGALIMFGQRLERTFPQRLPVGKEPYIFGPIIGKATIEPGFTFAASPYLSFENLREGFGARIQFTVITHDSDFWSDARTDRSVHVNFKDINNKSGWAADYVTLSAFYDFGKVKVIREFDPIVTFSWDVPLAWVASRSVSKTQRVSLRFEYNF